MSDPFRYIFRFCCDPGFNDEAELQALERYVREARIDDVAVFANVQELNTGHMTREEQDVYLRLMERVRDLLSGMGVTFSINHWHSVMHADLGKRMDPALDFRPMVDVEGNEAALCVCPLCEKWQRHIAGLYARYAQLEPSILWVEDDFRLHNHDALLLAGYRDWFCYCGEHLRQFNERFGTSYDRTSLLRDMLRPGQPHPVRAQWLRFQGEAIAQAAAWVTGTAGQRAGAQRLAPHASGADDVSAGRSRRRVTRLGQLFERAVRRGIPRDSAPPLRSVRGGQPAGISALHALRGADARARAAAVRRCGILPRN